MQGFHDDFYQFDSYFNRCRAFFKQNGSSFLVSVFILTVQRFFLISFLTGLFPQIWLTNFFQLLRLRPTNITIHTIKPNPRCEDCTLCLFCQNFSYRDLVTRVHEACPRTISESCFFSSVPAEITLNNPFRVTHLQINIIITLLEFFPIQYSTIHFYVLCFKQTISL